MSAEVKIDTRTLFPRVLSPGRDGWYVTIRCEGLKAFRYGPFPSRVEAGRFYVDAMDGVDLQLFVDTSVQPRGPFIPVRRVGKVCLMNEKGG